MGNFSKAVLIASVALCLHLSAFSQDISLKAKQITVKEAIELLKEKSGYSFVFSSADVNTNKRIQYLRIKRRLMMSLSKFFRDKTI